MRGIVTERVSKSKLRGIIELSMENEKDYEKNESKWRSSKKWRESKRQQKKTQKIGRGGRGVVIKDGRVWTLQTEEVKVITCGWEQRRRKTMERWEAPPPGPPMQRKEIR